MHRRAAWASLRGGRRLRAIGFYASAVASGDLRSIGRAAVALCHPSVGRNSMFRFLGRDVAWVARAEPWLQAFANGASVDRVAR